MTQEEMETALLVERRSLRKKVRLLQEEATEWLQAIEAAKHPIWDAYAAFPSFDKWEWDGETLMVQGIKPERYSLPPVAKLAANLQEAKACQGRLEQIRGVLGDD